MIKDNNHKMQTVNISARRLAELIHREGGLAGQDYASIDGVEGIRTQQRTIAAMRGESRFAGADFLEEKSIEALIEGPYANLLIRGRADLLLSYSDSWQVCEFKSFRGPKIKLSREGRSEHRAQALLYTAMLAEAEGYLRETYETLLIYASVDEDDYMVITMEHTKQELRDFIYETANTYLNQVTNVILWQERRNASIKAGGFPYTLLRSGQTELMREVLACLRDKRVLFAEAPTGIGKTMATLYPALKALSVGMVKRVFYATAMISTRDQASAALASLREESGFLIRSICLSAKEKLCLEPDLFCDQRLCPYAVNYYNHLPDALSELLNYESIDGDLLQLIASKHKLCPFELSLDVALFCDVIIGDYNHVFDPRIRLKRFFDDEEESPIAILVDEAHNLANRSRHMFSGLITRSSLLNLMELWKKEEYREISQYYTSLKASIEAFLSALNAIDKIYEHKDLGAAIESGTYNLDTNPLVRNSLPEDWILVDDFLALKKKPDRLEGLLGRLLQNLRQFFDEQRNFEGRQKLLQSFFDLLHFQNVLLNHFNQAYITAVRKEKDELYLSLLCLDAAEFISQTYYDKHPIVFFSATLYPQDFYENLLYAQASLDPPERLQLPSPFPQENRLILVDANLSLRYQDRAGSLHEVRDLIYKATSKKTGNYLVFVPSYAYLRQLSNAIKAYPRPDNTDFMIQRPGLNDRQKTAFLKRFQSYGDKTLIAIAVLGGMFSEGIDLQGEQLSGVICVGVGLPGISPERQLLAEYSQEHFGNGFLYAYVFPAFQRIQQAVGRLIRSETDTGFILLIDKRWKEEPYIRLFNEERQAHFLESEDDLAMTLEHFWEDLDQ